MKQFHPKLISTKRDIYILYIKRETKIETETEKEREIDKDREENRER